MGSVLVLYHSQEYGNTTEMAKAVAAGAQAMGAAVTLINTNERRMDIELYRTFDAVALGSPDYYSYIAGTLKTFLDDWYIARQSNSEGLEGKFYGLFYSHGGGGAVRRPLEELFRGLGMKVGETVGSRGRPDEATLDKCRKLGRLLAERVR
jgi:NAD(P)H dehydrogenase (quinone)